MAIRGANIARPLSSLPGRRSVLLDLSSRHISQSPVTSTTGPWPPCSVDQLTFATSIMVGSKIATTPIASKMVGTVKSRVPGGGTIFKSELPTTRRNFGPSIAIDATLNSHLVSRKLLDPYLGSALALRLESIE